MRKSTVKLFRFSVVAAAVGMLCFGVKGQDDYSIDDEIRETKRLALATTREVSELQAVSAQLKDHALVIPFISMGRLTLTSGTAVPSADQTGKSTLYYTPYLGTTVTIYDGGVQWNVYSFTEVSLSLTGLTTGSLYDVFLYSATGGILTLELSAAWANSTTRTDALVLQDGVYVKSSNKTRLYLGTFKATGATTTEDSVTNRYLWNNFNRRRRTMYAQDTTTANFTLPNSASWAAADGRAANSLNYVVGLNEPLLHAIVLASVGTQSGVASSFWSVGVGVDVTGTNSAQIAFAYGSSTDATGFMATEYRGYPGQGYHFLQWIVYGNATDSDYIFTNNQYNLMSGIIGWVDG